MFISINRKILLSITAFLFFICCIFFAIFFHVYAKQLQEGQNRSYTRNQYVVDLLLDNVALRKELAEILEKYPNIEKNTKLRYISSGISLSQEELSKEQRLNEEMRKNYNNNYETFIAGAKFISVSLFLVIFLIILLIFLLNRWVIFPMENLTKISSQVSQGILSSRLTVANKKFRDEFDILNTVFNQMLNNLEENIAEIKSNELFLQRLIDAIPEAIRVIDSDYNVVMANTALHKMFKLKESCVGKKCYFAYGFECEACPKSKYECPIKEIFERGKNNIHTIHEVNSSPLYISAAKLQASENKHNDYVIEAIHDLSNDVQFSHQQKVSSLAFLSTSIAHEMKNSLGAIRMIFEVILNNKVSLPERNKYLQMAYTQLVETIRTPERLLKLSQFNQEDSGIINVSSAVEDILIMIDYDAKRKGIAIQKSLDKNASVYGNESDFKMIILNITQNAIKAMPDGGTLDLDIRKQKNKVSIKIADTGIGMSQEQIKHIFEPFYSANTNAKSSGLGLAIVKSLVDKMKGKITVKSKEGKGSAFEITLPFPKKYQLSAVNE